MDEHLKRSIIIEHYQHPLNKGLDNTDDYIKVNMNSKTCIDNLDFACKFKDDVIEDIKFDGEACAISTSAASIMSELLKGKTKKEVEEYILAEMQATDTLEKKDIRKKAAEAKKKMDKLQHDLPKRRKEIQDEAQAEIDRFNQSQEINPLLLINIVLKF